MVHPHRLLLIQELLLEGENSNFCYFIMNKIDKDPSFVNNFLQIDEGMFRKTGVLNIQKELLVFEKCTYHTTQHASNMMIR